VTLPEIPLDLWRQFQTTIFGEKADDIQNAESFRWGVDDSLNSLPPDDGTNWEAEARRLGRFFRTGHTPGAMAIAPEERNPNFPFTLDLRRT